jgi:hypothetical protein
MRAAKAVLATIAHSPNAVQRAKLVQEAAERLNLPPSALTDDLRHLLRQQRAGEEGVEQKAKAAARPKEEVELCEHLAHVVDHPGLVALIREHLPLEMISDPACRLVADAALQSADTGRQIHDILRDHDDPDGELQRFAAEVLAAPSKAGAREFSREDAVKDLILRLWRRKLDKERAELERQAGPEPQKTADARRREITSHLHHLKRWNDGAAIIAMELLH